MSYRFVGLDECLLVQPADPVHTDNADGHLVKKNIIPAVAHMRQLYPFNLSMVLPTQFLDLIYDGQDINVTNILATDRIFDTLLSQYVLINIYF